MGLDISDSAVSAVLVRGGIKGNRIEDHRYIPLPMDRDNESLSLALETIAAEMDLEGTTCIASLPASLASYRNMEAPFKEQKKLRQILPYELESTLPHPPEDVAIDFNVLDGLGYAEQHHLFIAAVPKKNVGFYLGQLKLQQSRVAETISHWRQAVEIKPNQPTIHKYLATLLARQGDIDQAIEHYRQALKYKPRDTDSRKGLNSLLTRRKKLNTAEE